MTRIYTKSGDNGTTGLISGDRVAKDSLRVEAYGSVDELNSTIGVAISQAVEPSLESTLLAIQSDLFDMGADLASPEHQPSPVPIPRTPIERVDALEKEIDRMDDQLPELRQFILPGGSKAAAALHMARSVCRRAERRVITLSHHEPINPTIILYLNRLSDLLFTMARLQNQSDSIPETTWSADR